ncbi:MAG TPA: tetratricopeptide repeat protein, partial [Candidatus Sulfotelmatobacter sp.]|nr:tetratricopeptide repeat protein [Candidatus Sulfotelmatobacter sp.]
YKLNLYPRNTLLAPPLSQEVLAENEAFWDQADREVLQRLGAAAMLSAEPKQRTLDRWLAQAHLPSDPNADAAILASFYSRALDFWGVQLQKADHLPQAAARFERALNLNPDNLVAQINLEYNGNLRTKRKASVQLSQSIEDQFGKYRNWDQIVGANGPFDEPSFCYEQGRAFARSGNYRQAAHEFTRVKKLAPDNLSARLYLAQISLLSQMPDAALQEVQTIQADLASACQTNFIELLSIQTSAHLVKNDPDGAKAVVQKALTTYPTNTDLLATFAQVYMNFGHYSNALEILERQIKVQPNSPEALINKGFACLQMKAYQQAITPLTLALSLETNNTSDTYYRALFNRAIAYLQSDNRDNLDKAQQDYEVLQKAFTNAFRVYYGLGEIAYRKTNNAAAIKNYQLYLANAQTNTEEATNVLARLAELKRRSP